MVKQQYIPERGDIIWLDFNPQTGHEQRGRRPAIVLSPKNYNSKTNLAILCPITTKIKNYPFEVLLGGKKINGAILSDQVKNLDWQMRNAEFAEKANVEVLRETIENIKMLLEE